MEEQDVGSRISPGHSFAFHLPVLFCLLFSPLLLSCLLHFFSPTSFQLHNYSFFSSSALLFYCLTPLSFSKVRCWTRVRPRPLLETRFRCLLQRQRHPGRPQRDNTSVFMADSTLNVAYCAWEAGVPFSLAPSRSMAPSS